MRPQSRSRPQPTPAAPTRSLHSFSRTKAVHSATPILPSCNYCGNAHKVSECNIPSDDLFCDYCGKEGHQESVYFAKFPKQKQLRLQRQNLPTSFAAPQPKAKAPQPSTQALPTKGNSNKNTNKVQDHERDLLGRSMAFHTMPWLGSMFFPLHTILVSHQNLLLLFALLMSRHMKLVWHLEFLPLGR
jgi:hypothetical protein